MSRLLQKILSAAIFPAALMIASKVAGLALANHFLNLGWAIESEAGSIFSVQIVYPNVEAAIAANSYSNLVMIIVMMIGTAVTLFQGYFLHTSHQNPKVLIKLIQFDFVVWLADSNTIFPSMAVWLSFLWISTIISITQSMKTYTYPWISAFAIITSIVFTWLAARDFEKEIRTILPENGKLHLE